MRTTSSSPAVRPAATFQHVLRPMEAAAARRKLRQLTKHGRAGQAGSKRALTVRERSIRAQTKEQRWRPELSGPLCSSLRDGWMISLKLLGVFG